MTETWSFCLIFTLYVVSCSAAITVRDGQDVWAVNISDLKFEYSLDCSSLSTTCSYTWKHDVFTTVVQRIIGASCSSSNPDYFVECSYPSSTLVSTFTILKRLSLNSTEVVVEGTSVSDVTPIVIRLDYCDINDLENSNGVSLSPDLCDFNCVSTFSCNDGFVGKSADLTCLRNATWSSTNLICEPVSCSGSSCNNCCKVNSQSQLSNIDALSYNNSVTAECCEGFSDPNVETASFTCNESGSINPNLNCMPVSCSGSSCNNCCEVNSRSQLSNIDVLSYNKSVTAECCEGFSDPNVETASFTCNESGSIDLNLNCMPVMCSLDQCDNCCYSGPAVPAGNTLSYNQSVTVECCDGFSETNGTTLMNYTCLSNQSIAANLTCVKVRCSVETIDKACQIGCVYSNVSELNFGENITLECDTNYVPNITIASCIRFNQLDSTLNCIPDSVIPYITDIVTSTRPMTVENFVSHADRSTMTTSYDTNTPSDTTILQTVDNKSYVPWSTDKSFQTHSTATTDKSFQTHSTATITTTYPSNVMKEQSTMISLGGSLGLRTGSVGVAFVLYVTSLALCFGLTGETCEFITGGIVGLVIGIIAITDIIVCCVWTLIRKIQSESKVPGSTTSNDRGKPGDNSVTREEDVNMMPGSGNH